jgi:energy-coupling factor transporter ATP-binding protein EcfA2
VSAPALALEALAFRYPDGTEALRGVDLAIAPGETVGLVGPNGAGKSTIALNVVGFLHPSAGAVRVFGTVVGHPTLQEVRRRVGLVFQSPDDQLFMSTLFDDVAFGPLNLGLPEEEVRRRTAEALAAVGLAGLEAKFPGHLSGGQKRAAALAGVLAMGPDLLLLDEPSSNLDPASRRGMIDRLATLPQAKLIASHDLEMVLDLCPRVVVLDAGRVVADGPALEILSDAALMGRHRLEVPYSLRRDHQHRFPLHGTPHEGQHAGS